MTTGRALYTARVHTQGFRDGGISRSDDGCLYIRHALPGFNSSGTNAEQLFAAGWSACFDASLGLAALRLQVLLPADVSIDAEVDLCLGGEAYFLRARLNVSLPGLDRELAHQLIDAAHRTCPYSKAVRGNVEVLLNLL
ncbi:Ohr family peroxiredoxin [Pseudomonas sp. REP124]|uniref:Ohr family peroxiredoxin n=1 Tax=Pseudomonas sp. REP124 TaxID=2875731 RepID=UPI001CCC3230|nr:Ohr family peroxiredoxin [Pseudomonas sp. REP124]MBZ9781484.1 Ohr family peroxiredoxin [Pseudomonas sp. REP124]